MDFRNIGDAMERLEPIVCLALGEKGLFGSNEGCGVRSMINYKYKFQFEFKRFITV